MNDWEFGGFGLYVHWPFCEAKCPYCDFNSYVSAHIDHSRWTKAYLDEIKRAGREMNGRVLKSIFFGGGTPSLMPPATVAAIIDCAINTWPTANDLEVTLEANPSSVEADKFTDFRSGGVNRVSLGVQALNDQDLHRLGRLHSAKEARRAVDIAMNEFERVSFDLIYARQDQSLRGWEAELKEALTWNTDHLSLYQLSIEPGTAFGDRYNRGKLRGLPTDDLAADMYEITQELCTSAGLLRYEVSNHAKSGAESRHNKIYWNYGDYLGIGPGAHGRITVDNQRLATETALAPGAWLKAAEAGNGESLRTAIIGKHQAGEYLMMGLRVTDGIDRRRFVAMSEQDLDQKTIEELEELGLVQSSGQNLSVTSKGFTLLNSIVLQLLP